MRREDTQEVTGTALVMAGESVAVFKTDFNAALMKVMDANTRPPGVDHVAGWGMSTDASILVFDIEWLIPHAELKLWIPVKQYQTELRIVQETKNIGIAPSGKLSFPRMITALDIYVDMVEIALRKLDSASN